MFQYYTSKYLGYVQEKDQYRYEITIVDDDFTEATATPTTDVAAVAVHAAALIDIYSRRNLNVPKNLWLLSQYCDQKWGKYDRISLWKKYVPSYSQYHDDLQMYLTFS
jgi:hypothetical protein